MQKPVNGKTFKIELAGGYITLFREVIRPEIIHDNDDDLKLGCKHQAIHEFIQQEKKCLKATALGFTLIDAVPNTLKDPLLTAQWEQQLDDIANNKGQDINGFLKQQIDLLKAIVSQLKTPPTLNKSGVISNTNSPSVKKHKAGDPCPDCGNTLEIRSAIRGIRVGQDYIGCSHFPDCRFYLWPLFNMV